MNYQSENGQRNSPKEVQELQNQDNSFNPITSQEIEQEEEPQPAQEHQNDELQERSKTPVEQDRSDDEYNSDEEDDQLA